MKIFIRCFRCLVVTMAVMILNSMFLLSCTESPNSSQRAPAQMMSIYDTIIIASTEPVVGEKVGDYYKFDFSDQLPAINGEYDDLFISHIGRYGIEISHSIWDSRRAEWDQCIAYRSGLNNGAIEYYRHSILSVGLKMGEYMNDSSIVTIAPMISPLYDTVIDEIINVMAVRYNPGYDAIYLTHGILDDKSYFAYDGKSYWVKTDTNIVTMISIKGNILDERIVPARIPPQIEFVDNGFAYLRGSDSIIILDKNFNETCGLYLPSTDLHCLGWGDDKLWVANWQPKGFTILLGINLDSSCQIGEVVITDSLPFFSTLFSAIAFDGTHLVALNTTFKPDMLYRISMDGKIDERIFASVYDVTDIQIHKGIIHMMCSGPTGFATEEKMIGRFRMESSPF